MSDNFLEFINKVNLLVDLVKQLDSKVTSLEITLDGKPSENKESLITKVSDLKKDIDKILEDIKDLEQLKPYINEKLSGEALDKRIMASLKRSLAIFTPVLVILSNILIELVKGIIEILKNR